MCTCVYQHPFYNANTFLTGEFALRSLLWIALTGATLIASSLSPMDLNHAGTVLAQGEGPNLLQDGDFEWGTPWEFQDDRMEIQVAPGWRAWWLNNPPAYVRRPYNCAGGSDNGCYWAVPEFRDVQRAAHAYRVHGGYQAQKYFTYGRMHQAGLMQQVGNIQPGSRLRFSVYMQAWMCYKYEDCDHGKVSDQPAEMHLRVGIDPTGGDNPFSPDIIWSPERAAWDTWVLFQVEAVAKNSTVTVFTHSRVDWDWARANNDVYVDDASLVVIGQAPTPVPTRPKIAATQPAVTQRPKSTSTPTRTSTPTPTFTPTATNTPLPTETPVRRVVTLPPDDTATPIPPNLASRLAGSGNDSSDGWIGIAFLVVAFLLGSVLAGVVLSQRRNPGSG